MSIPYPWDVYTEQLQSCGSGVPLYDPEPTQDGEVLIGDVGHIHRGQFHRLFNATLPAEDPVNHHGVPEEYTPFILRKEMFQRREGYIPRGSQCSRGITSRIAATANIEAHGVSGKLRFDCTDDQAAVLVLEEAADHEEYLPSRSMREYVVNNHKSWYRFATIERDHDIAEDDLVFVRGYTKTSEWAIAVCVDQGRESNVTFTVDAGSVAKGSFSFTKSVKSGMAWQHHSGPQAAKRHGKKKGKTKNGSGGRDQGGAGGSTSQDDLKKDQCIFLQIYKVKRRFGNIGPKIIKAAAEPRDPPSSGDSGTGVEPITCGEDEDSGSHSDDSFSIETVPKISESYDPLLPLFDYILENSVAEVAIASDWELAILHHLACCLCLDIAELLAKFRYEIETSSDGVSFLALASEPFRLHANVEDDSKSAFETHTSDVQILGTGDAVPGASASSDGTRGRHSAHSTVWEPPQDQQCRWRECGATLHDQTPGGIAEHLRECHLRASGPSSRVPCEWSRDGANCGREMTPRSLGKHIATVHVGSARRCCRRCGFPFAHPGAFAAHSSTCVYGPSRDALPGPSGANQDLSQPAPTSVSPQCQTFDPESSTSVRALRGSICGSYVSPH